MDGAVLIRYKEGDSSVARSKRVRSGAAALSLQRAVSASLETCGNSHPKAPRSQETRLAAIFLASCLKKCILEACFFG